MISYDDVESGRWLFNRDVASYLGITPETGQQYLLHYTKQLELDQKYNLTIWPYQARLGGLGHALVSAVEEAVFFHTIARSSQPEFVIKGDIATSESYSAIGPEVLSDPSGIRISEKTDTFLSKLLEFDAVVIAGEAKSHCVSWTIDDLLDQIQGHDSTLTKKLYLLEDCASSVVIPGVIDYTDIASKSYQRYAETGINIVQSTDPITNWSGILADI
jgi:nicotinamidase-related amidase